jgi:hypothetical protein
LGSIAFCNDERFPGAVKYASHLLYSTPCCAPCYMQRCMLFQ